MLASQLPPVEISKQLAVNGEGRVHHMIVADEAQADPARRAFIAAAWQAAPGWRFTPLAIRRAEVGGLPACSERSPFSQYFVFRFEWCDGQPISSTQVGAAPGRT